MSASSSLGDSSSSIGRVNGERGGERENDEADGGVRGEREKYIYTEEGIKRLWMEKMKQRLFKNRDHWSPD